MAWLTSATPLEPSKPVAVSPGKFMVAKTPRNGQQQLPGRFSFISQNTETPEFWLSEHEDRMMGQPPFGLGNLNHPAYRFAFNLPAVQCSPRESRTPVSRTAVDRVEGVE